MFAGQRLDGFYVDLGSVFDLLDLRPFQNLHLLPSPAAAGVNGLRASTCTPRHPGADQRPHRRRVDADRCRCRPRSVIGVWASASRQKALVRNPGGADTASGPWAQVSRLGNPLVNEALIPMTKKDYWNSLDRRRLGEFTQYVDSPSWPG